MKKVILLLVLMMSFNASASAGVAFLESCTFGYNADYNLSGYTGLYRSGSGNRYSFFFSYYCPYQVTL